ncbi:putative disease resistance rpp13-like protein 1 [Quercus suber]|uniref:Disease resistance rpp13-like protein 1 n=1 Tax=Quercus suber TaxID=58331 RepID=A0AAW0IK03_QUESU
MAAALVGGAFRSATLQVLFDRMASQEVVKFIRGRKFGRKLESKIQEVVDKLENLASQINAIGLREGVEGRSSQRVPTTSLVDPDTIIYGRDDDEKAIVSPSHLISDKPTLKWPSPRSSPLSIDLTFSELSIVDGHYCLSS